MLLIAQSLPAASVAMPSWVWALLLFVFGGALAFFLKRWIERIDRHLEECQKKLEAQKEAIIEVKAMVHALPCRSWPKGGNGVGHACHTEKEEASP